MESKTLVVLAAGMGSRFGGPKQLFPVGPNGEFIIDYSIYSAIKYGFTNVVFVTRFELLDQFINTIGKRLEGKVGISYVIQDMDLLPEGFTKPVNREKPWGTAHAIYCAKNYVDSKFAVITADDFYGDEAFKDLSNALDQNNYSVIGYHLGETLSKNGPVKRGVVLSENGIVNDIVESSCEYDSKLDKVVCKPLNPNIETMYLDKSNSVSMLMYGFNQGVFGIIENEMKNAFLNNKDNLDNFEFLMPDIMSIEIKRGRKILDIPTKSKWLGLTYQEDVEILKQHINNQIKNNVYPENLWKDLNRR